MVIERQVVNPFAENSYLLIESGKAILIDPGHFVQEEFSLLDNKIQEHKAELIAVVLTHAHVDHVLGVNRIRRQYHVPFYLNHEDLYHWNNYGSQLKLFGLPVDDFDFVPEPLDPQDNWQLGPFEMRVLYTPGHAPEHVSLYFEEQQTLIAGDTLFRESIGRTDLYRGDFKLLEQSIREQLYSLPDKTRVLAGHGEPTDIQHEKKFNPFVSDRPVRSR